MTNVVKLNASIKKENLAKLKKEAEKNNRSVSSMVDTILTERYNKKVS